MIKFLLKFGYTLMGYNELKYTKFYGREQHVQ